MSLESPREPWYVRLPEVPAGPWRVVSGWPTQEAAERIRDALNQALIRELEQARQPVSADVLARYDAARFTARVDPPVFGHWLIELVNAADALRAQAGPPSA